MDKQQTIWIDAPCSGIRMLWAGLFLAALLFTIWRFSVARSVLAFAISFVIILAGNIFRATGLFYLEAEIVKMPAFAHDGIGVVSFVFTCFGIVVALQKLRPTTKAEIVEHHPNKTSFIYPIIFLAACFSAIYVQIGNPPKTQSFAPNSVEFPRVFEGKPLQELGLTELEKSFMEDFPGIVRQFSDGEREIIIRFIKEPTRKLHSPTDCFVANRYQVSPIPLKIEKNGNRWSCFLARKDDKKLHVCQRIFTDLGENWTDVSAWYWSALSQTNENGYWAIAVAENASE